MPSVEYRARVMLLRENTNTINIEVALNKAAKILGMFGIPHYVCGGFCCQEYGYARYTDDVDIIVPDVKLARDKLSMNGFRENPGSNMTVTDRETRVEIDVLPGGKRIAKELLVLPMPTIVSNTPVYLTLPELINVKLSSYLGSKFDRARDRADVIELVKINKTPRSYPLKSEVIHEYQVIWDGLRDEGII